MIGPSQRLDCRELGGKGTMPLSPESEAVNGSKEEVKDMEAVTDELKGGKKIAGDGCTSITNMSTQPTWRRRDSDSDEAKEGNTRVAWPTEEQLLHYGSRGCGANVMNR
jgi:hypothetical protein